MSARLPEYMVPREIRVLDEIPLNLNHKFDRNALRKILENER
jgi:acyl-coenzyme A synthetase/AMP-(fatty) acid ligase